MDRHRTALDDAVQHWEGEAERARQVGSRAIERMGAIIVGRARLAIRTWDAMAGERHAPADAAALENARKMGLSILGVSMLLRHMWKELPESSLASSPESQDDKPHTIIDADVGQSPRWQDFRVHVAASGSLPKVIHPGSEHQQWYRDSDLWVMQQAPMQPTSSLRDVALGAALAAKYETLFPYVAVKE